MLQFSANLSLLFTELDFIDRFKAAKESGFDAVEIQFPYELPAELIKECLVDNQLKLVLFNLAADDLLQGGEGLTAVPDKHLLFEQALEQCLSYASILQPEAINILPGRCKNPEKIEAYYCRLINNLETAVDAFSPLGIKTVFEAINTVDMPGFIVHNGRQMLEIIEHINHPMLFIQYDAYHMQMMNENIFEFIKRYSDQIGHIQFADVPGRGQPGTGKIHFDTLFSVIERTNYSGWVGAEYNPVGNSKESLKWLAIQQ